MGFYGVLWGPIGLCGGSMEFCGALWGAMGSYDVVWASMGLCGVLCVCMGPCVGWGGLHEGSALIPPPAPPRLVLRYRDVAGGPLSIT